MTINIDLDSLGQNDLILYSKFSLEIQKEFNKISNAIIKLNNHDVFAFSTICSRNPYQSNLFTLCLCIFFINYKINNTSNLLRFHNCPFELKSILSNYFPDHTFLFKSKPINFSMIRLFADLIQNIRFCINAFKSKSKARVDELKKKYDDITLIDTFLIEKNSNSIAFEDRYYNNILNYVDKKLHDKIYFLPHLPSNFNYRMLNRLQINSKQNLIYKIDFLRLNDFFKSFYKMIFTKINSHNLFFYQFDLSKLIADMYYYNRLNHSSFRAIINYNFVKNLREKKINVNLFIDWNENQPIDKGLIKGFKDFYSGTKIKGYQGYIVSREYNFYTIPTDFEIKSRVIPDEISVIGNKLKSDLKSISGKVKVSVAPAFRFSDYKISFNHTPRFITIVLPIGFSESFDLIESVSKHLKSNFINKFEIILKPHPTTDLKKLSNKLSSKKINYFKFHVGTFESILKESILILGNTSSALMESIVNGVPVIIIPDPKGITQNPIPSEISNDFYHVCDNLKNIKNLISIYLNKSIKERENAFNLAKSIKDGFYLKPNKKNVQEFLNIS